MKIKILLTLFSAVLFLSAGAQRLRMSTGAGFIYGSGKVPEGADEFTARPSIKGYGLFLYPRYNMVESETGSVSIGFPVLLGFSGDINFTSGASLNFTADVPATIDYNFGSGSTKENLYGFGAFIGAGFGYTYSNQTYEYNTMGAGTEKMKGITYGPMVHGGIKLNLGEKIYFLRAFYKMGMETEKFRTYGGTIGVSF